MVSWEEQPRRAVVLQSIWKELSSSSVSQQLLLQNDPEPNVFIIPRDA